MEMVEELEISHLEPSEISAMIDHEISALFPTWMNKGECQHQRQHSFNYEEDEDANNHNPFFLSSCPSSPHRSLPNSGSYSKTHFRGNHSTLTQERPQDLFVNEDGSSPSSMNSFKCSNFQYYENEHGPTVVDEVGAKQNKLKCTRSSHREEGEAHNFLTKRFWYPTMHSCGCRCGGHGSSQGCTRSTRMSSSMEERRSLQLQRLLLLEEMYKYKRFNTIGAMESIGFRHPDRGGRYPH